MRLFEAIVDANHRAARGETAGLRPSEFGDALPVVALTCIDPRLNPLLPEVLGIPEEQFIWLRNAGNIITGPMSSTMRSIALACAVKGGREIAVIGHTDCRVRQTSASDLIGRFQALGVSRAQLPDNLNEFFGLFASERANVLKAVEHIRQGPLISRAIPVHGLLVNIENGQLEWLANGYQTLAAAVSPTGSLETMKLAPFEIGNLNFPETKIGESATHIESIAPEALPEVEEPTAPIAENPKLRVQPSLPSAPPIPPRILRRPGPRQD